MIKITGHQKTTHRLSDILPWAMLVSPGTIMQKDAIFQSVFEVRGHDFFSSSANKIETIVAATNNMCMYIDAGWSIFVEAQRYTASYYPKTHWNNPALKVIDEERHTRNKIHPLFDTNYYLSVCYKKPTNQQTISKFFSNQEPSLEQDLEEFLKKKQDIFGLLKESFLYIKELNDNELLTYLHSCVSDNRHRVLAPPTTMYIDSYVSDVSLKVGETLCLGSKYLGVISVHDFPHATRPDILEELHTLEIEFRWQTRMIFLDEMHAIQEIKKYRRKHYAQRKGLLKVMQEQKTGEEALENTESIMRAMDSEEALELAGKNLVRFGYITSVVVVSDRNIEALQHKKNTIKEVFQKKGFIVKDEQLNAMDAWLSSLPGEVYSNVRKFLVHSVNFAHILPLSSRWRGTASNLHMKKICNSDSPHMIVNSQSNVFYLNLNNGDVGHTFIVGPTGAGKSTILGMLCAQFMRYPNAQVLIFDKDYSALPLTKNTGGICYDLAAPLEDEAQHSSSRTIHKTIHFQPLRHIDTSAETHWAINFCHQLLTLHNVPSTEMHQEEIERAVQLLKRLPPNRRTLSSLCEIIQDNTITQVLYKYCIPNIFGQLFDQVEEQKFDAKWIMFEMNHLMKLGEKAIMPALTYLFYKIESLFTGNPTMLVLDEGWLFLQHPTFAEQFKIWLKTLRKKNVFLLMATQEISDAIKSPLLETIISACQTRIYLPDKSATQPYMKELYYKFGLQEQEIQIIASAIPKKEYYISTSQGTCLFSLDLEPRTLDMLTNIEANR